MSVQISRSHLTVRRAQLLAELFFQELEPVFMSRATTPDVGYDLLVGFSNDKSGINTFAVQIKATERPVRPRFPLQRAVFDRFAHSNVPGILIVADVKHNRLYYAWLRSNGAETGTVTVSVPLVEITDRTKAELRRELRSARQTVAAAG